MRAYAIRRDAVLARVDPSKRSGANSHERGATAKTPRPKSEFQPSVDANTTKIPTDNVPQRAARPAGRLDSRAARIRRVSHPGLHSTTARGTPYGVHTSTVQASSTSPRPRRHMCLPALDFERRITAVCKPPSSERGEDWELSARPRSRLESPRRLAIVHGEVGIVVVAGHSAMSMRPQIAVRRLRAWRDGMGQRQ